MQQDRDRRLKSAYMSALPESLRQLQRLPIIPFFSLKKTLSWRFSEDKIGYVRMLTTIQTVVICLDHWRGDIMWW